MAITHAQFSNYYWYYQRHREYLLKLLIHFHNILYIIALMAYIFMGFINSEQRNEFFFSTQKRMCFSFHQWTAIL